MNIDCPWYKKSLSRPLSKESDMLTHLNSHPPHEQPLNSSFALIMTKKRPSVALDRDDPGDARPPPQKQAKASFCTANVCFNINHYESGLHHDTECEMDVCGSDDHGAARHKDLMDSKTHYMICIICDTENHHSTQHHEQAVAQYDPCIECGSVLHVSQSHNKKWTCSICKDIGHADENHHLICPTCFQRGHARSNTSFCPLQTVSKRTTTKALGKTQASVIKASLVKVVKIKETADLLTELVDDYTIIAACASRLLNLTCVAWINEGKEIPQFDQCLRSELFTLVKTGINVVGKSDFYNKIVEIWNHMRPLICLPGHALMIDTKHSVFLRDSFKGYETTNLPLHLENASKKLHEERGKQILRAIPWDQLHCVDGSEFPLYRRNLIIHQTMTSAKTKQEYIQFRSRKDDKDCIVTETEAMKKDVFEMTWKKPSMQNPKTCMIPKTFLEKLIKARDEIRRLYLDMCDEWKVSFMEEWNSVKWAKGFAKTAIGRIGKVVMKQILDQKPVTIGEFESFGTGHIVEALASNATLKIQWKDKDKISFVNIGGQCLVDLQTLISQKIKQRRDCNLVNSTHRLMSFIHRMNGEILANHVPLNRPPNASPLWTPPAAKSAPLCPSTTFTPHYIDINGKDAILEFYKRCRAKSPELYPEKCDDPWTELFDIDQFLLDADEKPIYKNRLFAQALSTDGYGCSILFNKVILEVQKLQVEAKEKPKQTKEDVEALQASQYDEYLRGKFETLKEWQVDESEGRCKLEFIANDPGKRDMASIVRKTEEFYHETTPRYDFKQYGAGRYYWDAGITRNRKHLENAKTTVRIDDKDIYQLERSIPSQGIDFRTVFNWMEQTMRVVSQLCTFYRCSRSHKFENYMGKARSINVIAKELLGLLPHQSIPQKTRLGASAWKKQLRETIKNASNDPLKRQVVFFGAAKIGSQTHIKGSLSAPHAKLVQALERHENVLLIFIDEFNTSQRCYCCKNTSMEMLECKQTPKARKGKREVKRQQRSLGIVAAIQTPGPNQWVKKTWALKRCYNSECRVNIVNRDFMASVNIYECALYMFASFKENGNCNTRPVGLQRDVLGNRPVQLS
jgi:hypothetical protein